MQQKKSKGVITKAERGKERLINLDQRLMSILNIKDSKIKQSKVMVLKR